MTIKQFAKEKGVSTQAVYQKIKAAGLEISDLRAENSAELTESGLKAVNQLFVKQKEKTDNKEKLVDRVKELEKQVSMLESALQEARADRDRWAAQAEAAQQTAQQAQALNMATLKALPAPQPPAERRGLLARLFNRNKNADGQEAGKE